jgi:2-hydroxychromene-2-carboxylate isomerase
MAKVLEFFFDYASPYSYLASTRVEAVARRAGAELQWRPFLLGAVFKESGNTSPASSMCKARYMMKDLLDWTRHYDLPDFVLPEGFPSSSLKAARLGLVADEQGRLVAFTHALYREVFAEGKDLSDLGILAGVLQRIGLGAEESLRRSESPEIKDRLRRNTDGALARGAFGAPTFFIGDDMYFGNDRLPFVETALKAA